MKRGLLAALTVLSAGYARAQGPPCPEFRIHTHTADDQTIGDVASDAAGNFAVIWHDGSHPGFSMLGRLFAPSGTPRGPEFPINAETTRYQGNPQAGLDASGRFVVAWNVVGESSSFDVLARRFDAAGVPGDPEFQVNTYTSGAQTNAAIAVRSSGSFVVVWESQQQDGQGMGIYGQRFDSAGVAEGPEFRVNTSTLGDQRFPAVAMDGTGRFFVVWSSDVYTGDDFYSIVGQRFDALGARLGAEFRVNTYTAGEQGQVPAVASDASGNTIVIWTSQGQDGDLDGVYGQRYDATGAAAGPEFRVNDQTTGSQISSSVAVGTDGDFLVTWKDGLPGANDDSVFARRFSPSGDPRGPGFRLNTEVTRGRGSPVPAATDGGGFVVAWSSLEQDGSGWGVYASAACQSRFYTVAPCRVVDTRQPPGLPLGASSSRSFDVAGACGIPAGARAVALNVTAVNPTDLGNLRLYPAGQPVPTSSTINFAAGTTRANNAILPLGTGGQVTVQCDMPPGSTGTTHLLLDVSGYFGR
jgi:hypothetical protein